jgi:heptose I phosphotransferase
VQAAEGLTVATAADNAVFVAAGRWVVRHAPDWPAFAGPGWLDTIMTADVPDREHRKQGRAIGRWTLTAPDGRRLVVFLKRHFELPRRHGWLARLFPGRAWSPGLQEWEHLQWAAAAGLPVPRAVAAGEWRGPGGRLQSFLAVEELADQLPLHEAIPLAQQRLPADEFRQWKLKLVGELARHARELHDRRAYHQDLYLCHFYLPAADAERLPRPWGRRLTMIDFHRLTVTRLGNQYLQVKDLAQLIFSTVGVAGWDDADWQQFWSGYGGGLVRRLAEAKARRYLRHNAKRAAGL